MKLFKLIFFIVTYITIMWLYFSKIVNQPTNNLLLYGSTLLIIAVSVVFFKLAIKTIFKLLNL